jgi:hypothetical protein
MRREDTAMQTVMLSESAVATLRLHIEGEKRPASQRNLAAYHELVEAGIMEPVPGPERSYRLTAEGREHREAILERETERIERERFAPPDASNLSGAARELRRRLISGRVEVIPENRPAFRELAAARIILLGHSFDGGPESYYRWTYHGWHRRFEPLAGTKEAV